VTLATRFRGLAWAVGLSILGFACGGARSARPIGPPVAIESVDPFGVLDAFGGAEAVARLRTVVADRTADCMAERGFIYQAAQPDAVGAERAARERNLTFGLPPGAPPEGTFGLTSTEEQYRSELTNPNEQFLSTQSHEYRNEWQAALDGFGGPRQAVGERSEILIGIDGCDAKALVAVYGDLETAFRVQFLTGTIREDAVARVLATPSVAAALKGWNSCASDAGFDLANPGEGYRLIESRLAEADADDIGSLIDDENDIYQMFLQCESKSRLSAVAWPLVSTAVGDALTARSEDVARLQSAIATHQ
jgi:hypothetical protein